jgi:hypothetical protein
LKADEPSGQSVRVVLVYTNTGQGHKSSADGLTEWILNNAQRAGYSSVSVRHVDIYRLAKVLALRSAAERYQFLCRHARRLYNLLFRITDNGVAKKLIASAVARFYGERLAGIITEADPNLVVVLHPLFMSDVLCKLRDRSHGEWKIVSFVTDLGIAHAGWVSSALDAAIFVHAGQIDKFRRQRCLPPENRTHVARAPVRASFTTVDTSLDGKLMQTLGLSRPYLLYIPGPQPTRSLVRQVRHLAADFEGRQLVIVGALSIGSTGRLRKINNQVVHLESLSSGEMAVAMRNAEVVAGKAGPAVMAEAASVYTGFIPTAEVGRQEVGNALVGESLYGVEAMPSWGLRSGRVRSGNAATQVVQTGGLVMGDAEVYRLLMRVVTTTARR